MRRFLLAILLSAQLGVAACGGAWLFGSSSTMPKDMHFPDCPKPDENLRSQDVPGADGGSVRFVNQYPDRLSELELFWINTQGQEVFKGAIEGVTGVEEQTFTAHAYRIKNAGLLVKEHRVEFLDQHRSPMGRHYSVAIEPCAGVPIHPSKYQRNRARDEEFNGYIHDQNAPCVGDSRDWSCIRCLSSSEVQSRDPKLFGFHGDDVSPGHDVGAYRDKAYTRWINDIPHLTPSGYLKMSFSKKLKEILLPFYKTNANKRTNEQTIGGGYANDAVHPLQFLSLDQYPQVHDAVSAEMKEILEWWTDQHLHHTATYGVRIYQRESMLITHVDRMETHIASVVLQIDQKTDPGGGWPLEVLKADGEVCEVYLQAGEMVLYEGARIRHGRPMRFRGDLFANTFVHFSPMTWHGESTIQENKRIANVERWKRWKKEREEFL